MKLQKFFPQPAMLLLISIPVLLFSCDKDDDDVPATNTITDVAVSGANFTSLETAVLKANLQTTLSGTRPFTVFLRMMRLSQRQVLLPLF